MEADDTPPTSPSSAGETASLNKVLSEVIDLVQDVKQAHRKVPETHALHAELDQLFADLATWAQLIVEQDEALGVSPLDAMPSVAGRKPPNLWPGKVDDDAVRTLIDDHLDWLGQHLRAVRTSGLDNARSREIIDEIERGVDQHRQALREL
jgi:DNA-binding ferritin-like protein